MNVRIRKEDLSQMDRQYFQSLDKERLVDVACDLREYGVRLTERLEQNSSNSSKPPSSDTPYKKGGKRDSCEQTLEEQSAPIEKDQTPLQEPDISKGSDQSGKTADNANAKRSPGKQTGAQGFGRTQTSIPQNVEPHYPENCALCGKKPEASASPYMGHYTYELELSSPHILRIVCTLHHYYTSTCECGHENKAMPGEGFISEIQGRKRDVKLSEYTIVGPMLATFIAALNRRCGMSRNKIREFLLYWFNFELSTGIICKSIREAGIACYPVVEQLVEELQKQEKVHLDETPWYQKGQMLWLWVAVSAQVAVYYIGTRKKEELLKLITESFFGWLITDGYMAYRSFEKRQRCLAHLIRKAIALTGAVDQKACQMGDWFLKELRGLIQAMAQGEDGMKKCWPILARLKKACNLGSESDHDKLKALAKEILNDWDAVVAFVKNPGLPATNNEAERALRWAVILRKITFGTRTEEGSQSFAAFLSVFETCRLRNVNPWQYIAHVITYARKGLTPPLLPPK